MVGRQQQVFAGLVALMALARCWRGGLGLGCVLPGWVEPGDGVGHVGGDSGCTRWRVSAGVHSSPSSSGSA